MIRHETGKSSMVMRLSTLAISDCHSRQTVAPEAPSITIFFPSCVELAFSQTVPVLGTFVSDRFAD